MGRGLIFCIPEKGGALKSVLKPGRTRGYDYERLFLETFNADIKRLEENGRLHQLYRDIDAGKYDKQKSR